MFHGRRHLSYFLLGLSIVVTAAFFLSFGSTWESRIRSQGKAKTTTLAGVLSTCQPISDCMPEATAMYCLPLTA